MRERLVEAFRTIHLDVDPDRPIRHYDGPVQQLIEIAKLACFPSRLVVVDEPASRLRPEDVERLQYLLSVLRQNGTTILYVTSSMEEVFHFASRLTVLDRGRVIETSEISSMDENQLVQLTYAQLFSRRKLEKSNLELAYLNNLNRNVINNIPIPIVVADSRGSIMLVNRCLESLAQVRAGRAAAHGDRRSFLKLPPAQSEALARDIAARRHHEIRGMAPGHGFGAGPGGPARLPHPRRRPVLCRHDLPAGHEGIPRALRRADGAVRQLPAEPARDLGDRARGQQPPRDHAQLPHADQVQLVHWTRSTPTRRSWAGS